MPKLFLNQNLYQHHPSHPLLQKQSTTETKLACVSYMVDEYILLACIANVKVVQAMRNAGIPQDTQWNVCA